MSFIEFDSAVFSWPGSPRPAIRGLSFRIDEGEYVAIVGRNGSGKSSLLRLMNGLRHVDAGSVRVDGLDAADSANARALRSTLVLVFQSPPDQIVSTVVEEDVAFGPGNLAIDRAEIRRRVDEALAVVGLEAERKSPPHFLSAGQQQRLAVAGALAMRPRCIAFDEATAMLDPPSRQAMLDLMDRLNAEGVTIIHVTHDMSEAARAGRILMLDEGLLVRDAPPEAFFAKDGEVLESFGLPPAIALARTMGFEPRICETAGGCARLLADSIGKGLLQRPGAATAGAGAAPGGAIPAARGVGAAIDGAVASGAIPAARGAGASGAGAAIGGAGAGSNQQPPAPAFSLERLGYSYLRGTVNERRALSDISFVVPQGSVVALVGHTGSGKSTILQLLNSLALPSSGRILAFGRDPCEPKADLRALRMRAPLAVQRPESALFEPYSADDVAFGPKNQGLSGRALVERVREAMQKVGLPYENYRDRSTRSLSGGEKRRLALAGVLALDPEAILLDEPTQALDPAGKAAIMALITSFAATGKTVVFSTHSMDEAVRADMVAVLRGGALLAFGPPGEIFGNNYDEAWGIGRPWAAQVAVALADLGVWSGPTPLDIATLAARLGSRLEQGAAGAATADLAATAADLAATAADLAAATAGSTAAGREAPR